MEGVEEQRGQALSEVGLLIVLVVLVAVAGVTTFGGAVNALWAAQVAQAIVAI